MLFWPDMRVGALFFTRRAKETLDADDVWAAIHRYEKADWGDIPRRYEERNRYGVIHECQVIGCYRDRNGQAFWIITEPLHQTTHIKLIDEPWDER